MRSIEIQILGQTYSVKSDQDEEYVKSLALYVDEKLKEIFRAAPNVNHTKASIMVALGIADELFRLRKEQDDQDKIIEEKTRMLSDLLEQT